MIQTLRNDFPSSFATNRTACRVGATAFGGVLPRCNGMDSNSKRMCFSMRCSPVSDRLKNLSLANGFQGCHKVVGFVKTRFGLGCVSD